jgi:quercetin dioxygenase-like cupin family protein
VSTPPRILKLDEMEPVPGPGTLSWLPIRHTLGVRAFGCNAYVAEEAGRDVVEPHTEDPNMAHEELYFVARGRATFTIDGQAYEAPAGTYVFIPDPASHRHAVADEAGTTVLSFGGPPTFEASAWEWSFRAAPLARSDPAKAREILKDGLRSHPGSASLHYGLACVDALEGHREQALGRLRTAFDARPDLREWAREDSDLEGLRDDPEFRALVGS